MIIPKLSYYEDWNLNKMFQRFEMSKIVYLLIILIHFISAEEQFKPCRAVQAQYGIMCECSDDYCDTLCIPESYNSTQFVFVTSSEAGDRFNYEYGDFTASIGSSGLTNNLSIDQGTTYNKSDIIGFGGGWTGAVNYVLNNFSSQLRTHFYRSYFSTEVGIGYDIIRIPIGGTEFGFSPWTNDDSTEPDPTISRFTALDPRDIEQNNQLKEMQQITGNADIKFIGAMWSPPLWMKAMNEWYGVADNQLLPEYYQALATYHARWLNLTVADGIPIWGMSTGNKLNLFQIKLEIIKNTIYNLQAMNRITVYIIHARLRETVGMQAIKRIGLWTISHQR